jgi:hypothetical protein
MNVDESFGKGTDGDSRVFKYWIDKVTHSMDGSKPVSLASLVLAQWAHR